MHATIEKPASRASTPNDSDRRKPAAAKGMPALTPALNLALALSRPSTRGSLKPRCNSALERALVGAEGPRRPPARQQGERRQPAEAWQNEAPVDVRAQRRARGLDGPVDRVEPRHVRDPARQ